MKYHSHVCVDVISDLGLVTMNDYSLWIPGSLETQPPFYSFPWLAILTQGSIPNVNTVLILWIGYYGRIVWCSKQDLPLELSLEINAHHGASQVMQNPLYTHNSPKSCMFTCSLRRFQRPDSDPLIHYLNWVTEGHLALQTEQDAALLHLRKGLTYFWCNVNEFSGVFLLFTWVLFLAVHYLL